MLFLATHGKKIYDHGYELLPSWGYEIKVVRDQSEDRAELLAGVLIH